MAPRDGRPARPEDRPYFFDAGLRFSCTGCGACCTGATGTVWLNRREAQRIARHLGLAVTEFLRRYAYPFRHGHSLRERENGDCVFYAGGRCAIYRVRPTQCRTYPFWPEHVRSESAWARVCRECPGAGQGRLHDRERILAQAGRTIDAESAP